MLISQSGYTPVMYAAYYGHLDCVKYLNEAKGVNLNHQSQVIKQNRNILFLQILF